MAFENTNKRNQEKFKSVPYNERIIFIPHCVRSRECQANNSEQGWLCINCGKCNIGEFKKKAERIGYKVFIVPGFSLVKKLIKKHKPKAIVGISCEHEMDIAQDRLDDKLITQCLLLLKEGCVETEVDWDKLQKICFEE